VTHVTGIPHSPTGQTIVERAHQLVKGYLRRQNEKGDPHQRLNKVLFTLNYLCIFGEQEDPPIVIHHRAVGQGRRAIPGLVVNYKHPKTGLWEGP
ncbi:POK19 protein, partial [Corythaixoides concolor]|nr:POK19 protein [Corythaixoides concolor]